jgi:hypothetical protein
MALVNRLQIVAQNLINKFGSDIELAKHVQGAYNPSTGTMSTTTTVYNIKAVLSAVTQEDLSLFNVAQELWSSVSGKAKIADSPNYAGINNSWTVNGKKIIRLRRTTLQNGSVVLDLVY